MSEIICCNGVCEMQLLGAIQCVDVWEWDESA